MKHWVALVWLLASQALFASQVADAWSWGGIVAHHVGLKKVGTACLWRAYRAAPHHVQHHYNLGLSYRHRHQYQAAQTTFTALANRPMAHSRHQQTWQQLGAIAAQLGQHRTAFKWYQQMVSHPPYPDRAPHDLAHIYTRLTPAIPPPQDHGQWAAIVSQYEHALPPISPPDSHTRKVPIDW